jgi:ubiquinone biosynthesis protein
MFDPSPDDSSLGAPSAASGTTSDTSPETSTGVPETPSGASSATPQPAAPTPERFLAQFLPPNATPAELLTTIESALNSPAGPLLRTQVGSWVIDRFVPVAALVPAEYEKWRPPVRDAMLFVVSRLSSARLAPKIIEQLQLPRETTPEFRLLRLIAQVPGLQKLGQVIARNKRLSPALRHALSQLENGIRDVSPDEITAVIQQELAPQLREFAVKMDPAISSEASVSAVVRFTWRNPASGKRERGVFKVLKPHIPVYFAEDMDLLHELAEYFAAKHRQYGFAEHVLTDTFKKVRRLLRHEIRFLEEQKTLLEAAALYRSVPRVRVPQVIEPLCTSRITAMTAETGVKVTDAVAHLSPARRTQLAEQLIDALIAVPLFAAEDSSLFHADPHAGNLFYNERTRELVLLDWALTERLSRHQRRHLALLVFMVTLRDPVGITSEVRALSETTIRRSSDQSLVMREVINRFLDTLPVRRMPGAVDAMRLLQQLAVKGIRFPAPLIMFSKVLFTLDGILEDIGGERPSMALTLARHPFRRWLSAGPRPGIPLTMQDWIAIQCSAAFYGARMSIRLQQALLDRLLTPASNLKSALKSASNDSAGKSQNKDVLAAASAAHKPTGKPTSKSGRKSEAKLSAEKALACVPR